MVPPSVEEIANTIAKRDKVRIAPVGAYVLNILGLSTQIPANVVFVTDGSQRRVSIGKGRGILFKHTSEMRTFAFSSKLMQMIVTAMREIAIRFERTTDKGRHQGGVFFGQCEYYSYYYD